MVQSFALGAVVIVVLLHLGFMVLEATKWSSPLGQRLTNLSENAASETVGVGFNMGLYNGFLGLGLLWVTFALREREAYSAQWLFLTFIVVAGVVGAISMRNKGIFLFQVVPTRRRMNKRFSKSSRSSGKSSRSNRLTMTRSPRIRPVPSRVGSTRNCTDSSKPSSSLPMISRRR
jgi:putative membrane protein